MSLKNWIFLPEEFCLATDIFNCVYEHVSGFKVMGSSSDLRRQKRDWCPHAWCMDESPDKMVTDGISSARPGVHMNVHLCARKVPSAVLNCVLFSEKKRNALTATMTSGSNLDNLLLFSTRQTYDLKANRNTNKTQLRKSSGHVSIEKKCLFNVTVHLVEVKASLWASNQLDCVVCNWYKPKPRADWILCISWNAPAADRYECCAILSVLYQLIFSWCIWLVTMHKMHGLLVCYSCSAQKR